MSYQACHRWEEWAELNANEYDQAYRRGQEIWQSSQRRGLKDKAVRADGQHIQAIGEVAARAVAKALGIEWLNSMDTFKGADLGFNIEVRVMGQDWHGLRVREDDGNDKRVVGCVIREGHERELRYRIPGWLIARDAKRTEWAIDPRNLGWPMFAVPQDKLRGLAELRRILSPHHREVRTYLPAAGQWEIIHGTPDPKQPDILITDKGERYNMIQGEFEWS